MAKTAEEVWRLLGELIELQKQNERDLQETRQFLKEQSQETERQLKEQTQETERLMREQSEITDQKLQALSQETSQQIKSVNQQIGVLGHRFGEFAEAQVRPGIVRLFQARGIAVERVIANLWVQKGQEGIEVDLFVINGSDVVLVEVKSKLTQEDVDAHLERLEKFKRLMPEYADKRALGAVAGMVIAQDVDRYAYRKGLFVLGLSDDQVVILNDDKFQPQAW